MPGCKDLTGKQYNYLTVIEKTEKRKRGAVVWLCKCKCGNYKEVTSGELNAGRVTSCGCYNKEKAAQNFNDLTGQKFGRLTVLSKTDKRANNRCIIWHCLCDCGNEIDVASDRLLKKENGTKSCGCLQKEKVKITGHKLGKDLTNQKFGKLTPILLLDNKEKRTWLCRCDCGNICEVLSQYLLNGHVSSCGCMTTSKGEEKIKELLELNNINFISEKIFSTCKFKDTNYPAYFDFYVDNKYIIEYDGIQHFKPRTFNNISQEKALENFVKVQEHDNYKNQWCKENNIPLIRIPYTHYNDLCIEDLQLETSLFIVKENEND